MYYTMELRSEDNEFVSGWGKLKDISDVYYYIGYLVNKYDWSLTFTSLEYYNNELDNFEKWIKRVKKHHNKIFSFTMLERQITCYLKEEE